MKVKIFVFVLLFSTFISLQCIDYKYLQFSFQRVAFATQKENFKMQIIGYGKTKGQAFMDAQRNAKKISYKYREISRSYYGTNGSWKCVLIIEY